jgi:hypothetical protein
MPPRSGATAGSARLELRRLAQRQPPGATADSPRARLPATPQALPRPWTGARSATALPRRGQSSSKAEAPRSRTMELSGSAGAPKGGIGPPWAAPRPAPATRRYNHPYPSWARLAIVTGITRVLPAQIQRVI